MKKEIYAVAGGYTNNPTAEIETFPVKKFILWSNTTAYLIFI
jgi:hypothetical protein